MKKNSVITISCLLASAVTPVALAAAKPITIGIVVPVAIPAMNQIVKGYESTLNKISPVPVRYIVKNAQGDPNIQRSILQEFTTSVDIVAPIGTDASQMAIATIRDKPIIGIAADHLKSEAKKANNLQVTGVLDEVSVAKQIQFIHAALPQLKKLTLVYSTDDRIFSDVKKALAASIKNHITIQKLMVSQLSDLYSIKNTIAVNTQAIFILKDEMIVSGLNALIQQATTQKIPLIASDDGSVSKGAAFAVGVSENQIGVDAAKITADIIKGKKAAEIPVHLMTHYYVFLNPQAMKNQKGDITAIKKAAKKAGYPIQTL